MSIDLTATRDTLADLARDGRGWVLVTVAFGWFLGLGIRLTAPTLIPYIQADFGIGLSTAGLLLSTLWLTYALLQLPGGVLGDRVGERAVLAGSAALAIVALVAGAVAWSLVTLFAAFVLLGSATGTYATTRFTSLTDTFPERSATALGLSSAAGNVGTVVLPAGAGTLAAVVGWRFGFAAAIPLFSVAAVGLWFAVPARTAGDDATRTELSMTTLRRLARAVATRRTLVFTVTMFLMSFVYQGFTSFYPTYLVSVKGLPEGTAALLYAVFFATGILVQPLAGAAADTLGDRLTVVGATLVSTAAFIALVTTDGLATLFVISAVLSAQLAFWPVAQAGVIDTLPADIQGTGFGLLRTVYLLLAATAPAVVGTLGDRGLFDEAFVLLGLCALVTALLGLLLRGE